MVRWGGFFAGGAARRRNVSKAGVLKAAGDFVAWAIVGFAILAIIYSTAMTLRHGYFAGRWLGDISRWLIEGVAIDAMGKPLGYLIYHVIGFISHAVGLALVWAGVIGTWRASQRNKRARALLAGNGEHP